ncbi:DUF6152 family protein [Thalassobaculum sp. OXR-137]|uniref:DUF6152 family protein n=1 Tax=Thalassobaculum sp. OXR-137 TaxID=3100173 RepID=UPI002AC8CD0E|nr:DUF6152 family protein [Thalassobaculum sp. OXR-137]WPZ36330.1 DUF6152 family protein [Thalassobaculum sp. OXR-137]
MTRSLRAAALSLAAALLAAPFLIPQAIAHHGWSWTTGGNIELTGIIREAKLGNPHGVLKVDADGEVWTVEVGQPWRNERAGLSDADFAAGTEITIIGEPSADPAAKLLKAERIILDGKEHPLYPDRS